MDLTKLSKDSLQNICEFLLDEHLVTEEQFLQIAASRPSNELKRTTDFIHSALCQDEHDHACQYYIEEQRSDCWLSPAHRRWLDEVSKLMIELDISSEMALRTAFKDALAVLSAYVSLGKTERLVFRRLFKVAM